MKRCIPIALACTALALACAQEGSNSEDMASDTAPGVMTVTAAAAADTTAADLWSHLQDAGYTTWSLWPGRGPLYAGQEPHGMLLTTYVNDLAREALTNGSMLMPAGAVIVKENSMPDSTLAAVTVMYKANGYDAEHNDWFWVKYMPDGTVEAAGRVDGCLACHSAARDRDYLMTSRPQS